MVNCKICKSLFKPKHHLEVTCSHECRELNKKQIKRDYYERNKELVIARSREHQLTNPDKQKESYSKNKDKYRLKRTKYNAKYKIENIGKIAAYQKDYEQRPERREKMRNYRNDPLNKRRSNESGLKYREKNPRVIKNSHLKRKYGITIDVYESMLESQGGVCKICENPEVEIDTKKGKLKDLAVDHCHATGRVRGLLCGKCNKAIGKFKDDPVLLRKAADYLEE